MDNNTNDRYKLIYNEDELGYMIIDTEEFLSDEIHSWNLLCDLLNDQDKKIKELEEKIKKINRELELTIKYKKDMKEFTDRLYEENKQLKKSQKQLAINVLEELQTTFINPLISFDRNFACIVVKNEIDKLKDN